MIITTKSNDRAVEVGSPSYLFCLYSTIQTHIKSANIETPKALHLLKDGQLNSVDCIQAARELNKIRDTLSKISPEDVVWDITNPKNSPPWGAKISPVITSLGNYFITADGKDLFFELISLLQHAAESKQDVRVE